MKRSIGAGLLIAAMLSAACGRYTDGIADHRIKLDHRISDDRAVVIDRERRSVRFAGIVPINAKEWTMLEVLVCNPDSREHEALVMTRARPSHIHAALLALGARPGRPGGLFWDGEGFEMREPSGPPIGVRFAVEGAAEGEGENWVDARDWFTTQPPNPLDTAWRFTGSVLSGDRYAADTDGTIVSLVSFGTEPIGMSPAVTEVDAERGFDFVARPERVPPFGTPVTVELRLLGTRRSSPAQ